MARDFTKITSNFLDLGDNSLGPVLNGASAISVAARVSPRVIDAAGTGNRIFDVAIDGTASGIVLSIGTAGSVVRLGGRSQGLDTFAQVSGVTEVTPGSWYDVGGVLDVAGDAIRTYLDGVQDSSGAATFGAVTYTNGTPTGPDRVGASNEVPNPTQSQQFSGLIDYVAAWTVDIGTAGFASLNHGESPLRVNRSDLVFYMGLGRTPSSELDVISGIVGTINGELPVHPGQPLDKNLFDYLLWKRERFSVLYPS